ncbi:hypothetical protein EHS89_09385 [Amphritea balenae]|uniref:Lipoprotein n=2 Tax=Amphritea balenae TaxID=452629 RepID=A0A3P1SRI1_9GAMM|nr:hypothetical protein EHS89_09385 [Amphritea balenae]
MINAAVRLIRVILCSMLVLLLSGCITNAINNSGNSSGFKLSNLAKTEIDSVTDMHIREIRRLSRELAIKLYKRNPKELAKAPPGTTLETRINQLFGNPRAKGFSELRGADGISAIPVSFADDFQGDRVFALMAGISGMLHAAYNHQDEFFILDEIDHQKLYNSARNLEAIAWQLNNRRDSSGGLYILSNGTSPEGIRNLSYERIFGKLISLQDMMALLIADTTNRTITKVVHSAASMTLLPI